MAGCCYPEPCALHQRRQNKAPNGNDATTSSGHMQEKGVIEEINC